MPLLIPIALLFGCQLLGEIIARGLAIPVPGPVIGMGLLLLALLLRPAVETHVRAASTAILANLSLLFVPAGVGVVGNLEVLTADGPALMLVLFISTLLALLAGVGAFLLVRRIQERARA